MYSATSIVTFTIGNKSLDAVAKSPDSDTLFGRIYNGLTLEKLERLVKTHGLPKSSCIKILIDGRDEMFHGKDELKSRSNT